MAVEYEAISADVLSYIADVRGSMPIDKVFLFGSYAKGCATKESDVDLCFFLRSCENDIDLTAKLIGMTHKYDAFIEPHVFSSQDLANGNPFVKEVIGTGIEL